MTCIEVDLEDYKDEIRYTFCNNNNCLNNSVRRDFKKRFKEYIDELEKELFIFNVEKRTPERILSELVSIYADLN